MLRIRHIPAAGILLAASLFVIGGQAGSALASPPATTTINVGVNPSGIAAEPGDGTIWVANYKLPPSVSEISGKQVIRTITLPTEPNGTEANSVAADGITNTVWVTDSQGEVFEIDALTGAIVDTITIKAPKGSQDNADTEGIAVDPNLDLVFVAARDWNDVIEFAESSPDDQFAIPVGNPPQDIALDPAFGTAWVTNSANGTVCELVYQSLSFGPAAVANTVVLPTSAGVPGGVAVDHETGQVFVTSYAAKSVAVISEGDATLEYDIPLGGGPFAVAAGGHGEVWVTIEPGGSMAQGLLGEIDETTGELTTTYPVGYGPDALAVVPGSGVYVANQCGSSAACDPGTVTFLQAGVSIPIPHIPLNPVGHRLAIPISVTGFPATKVGLALAGQASPARRSRSRTESSGPCFQPGCIGPPRVRTG